MTDASQLVNSVLIQGATLADIERMINRAVDARMKEFYDNIRSKPPVLIPRKKAASDYLRCSLPTLDAYGKYGILHPRRVGGRIFYAEDELLAKSGK